MAPNQFLGQLHDFTLFIGFSIPPTVEHRDLISVSKLDDAGVIGAQDLLSFAMVNPQLLL
jgi:hypothetical protein